MDATSGPIKKNREADVIISLEPMPGKQTKAAYGMVDNRLFTGENQLHAKMDQHSLWYLQYDAGVMPKQLQQRFTNWQNLYKFTKDYFENRNIQIKEIKD